MSRRKLQFTLSEQRCIAYWLANYIMQQKPNYFLGMLIDFLTKQRAEKYYSSKDKYDRSGEELLRSLELINLDKKDLIEALMNSDDEDAKRFAAVVGGLETAGLLDQSEEVREATKYKMERDERTKK